MLYKWGIPFLVIGIGFILFSTYLGTNNQVSLFTSGFAFGISTLMIITNAFER